MNLKGTYIKNDYGRLRELYFRECEKQGLHNQDMYEFDLSPESYAYAWIYEDGEGILQHSPTKKTVTGLVEVYIIEDNLLCKLVSV